jgi:hypothetical protein
MRGYTQSGRFDSDFETNDILSGVNSELRNPVGTIAQWWFFDLTDTNIDPIYDVGDGVSVSGGGRKWYGPYSIPIVRAVISQGSAKTSQAGFYKADELHLTINIKDLTAIDPNLEAQIYSIGQQDKSRVVWKNEVYRPYLTQQRGIVAERYTLLSIDCLQVMPEELVNDPQFASYAN